ncbi:MAG: SpoIIE family protein phosphatase [Candidatus Riflebacteria bacterium]|nr:SpoIIE family protein phosphatase [Candidatus Riflebacteria bacterium]
MPYLVLLNADGTTSTFSLTKDRVTLGSREDNDLIVPFPEVSRHHAEVVRGENGYYLTDLRSTHHVYVSGRPVEGVLLKHRTVFTLGPEARLLFLQLLDEAAIREFGRPGSPPAAAPGHPEAESAVPRGRTVKELESLIEVAARVNSSLDLDEVLDTVLERALSLTQGDRGFVMLVEDGHLVPRRARNMTTEALTGDRFSFSRSFASRVVEGGQALAASDIDSLPQYTSDSIIAQNIRSIMCAPLAIKGETFGCLYVDLQRPAQHISDAHMSFFTALANHAAIAIHNARMAESLRRNQASLEQANRELERSLAELESLYELSRSINRSGDVGSVLKLCLGRTRKLLEGEVAALFLYDSKRRALKSRMVLRSSSAKPDPATLEAIERLSLDAVLSRTASLADPLSTGDRPGRIASAPLVSDERCLGALTLVAGESRGGYTPRDLSLLSSVANLVALSIEKFRAHQQRLVQERLKEEIENARKVQRLLLPRSMPQSDRLELASKLALPNRVGGDYYDFVPLGERRLALVLADVAGHDIAAAIILAMGRSLLRTLLTGQAAGPTTPAAVLGRMNPVVIDDTGGQRFISLFLGLFDTEARTLRYSNAGGPNPLMLKPGELEPVSLTAGGIPLGLFPGHVYGEETVELAPGSVLLFFTDGLVEAQAPDNELFGIDRVKQALVTHREAPCLELVNAIYGAALAYTQGRRLQDDFTLVAVRVRAAAR